MFPDFVRNGTQKAYSLSLSGLQKTYSFSRSSLWIVGTSFVILALPVLFEVERVQTEEAALMQQRQVYYALILNYLCNCQISVEFQWKFSKDCKIPIKMRNLFMQNPFQYRVAQKTSNLLIIIIIVAGMRRICVK